MDIMSYLMGQNSAIKKGMHVEVVTELPTTGVSNVVYLVPKQDTGDNDIFDEYLWVDDDWEHIGTTDIDLSNYYTKSEVDAKIPPYYELIVGAYNNVNTTNSKTKAGEIFTDAYAKGILQPTILMASQLNTQQARLFTGANTNITDKPTVVNYYGITSGPVSGSGHAANTLDSIWKGSLTFRLTWNDNVCTCTQINYNPGNFDVLSTDNTASFTPTSDYNPATKKYVDDSIAAIPSGGDLEKCFEVAPVDANDNLDWNQFPIKTWLMLPKNKKIGHYDTNNNFIEETGTYNEEYTQIRLINIYVNKKAKEEQPSLGNNQFVNFISLNRSPALSTMTPIRMVKAQGTWSDNNNLTIPYTPYGDTRYDSLIPSYWYMVNNINTYNVRQTFANFAPRCSVIPNNDNDLTNKKYVDDSIASAITDALGGSY